MSASKFGLGQLRHLYKHLLEGQVTNQNGAAQYLVGPAIEMVEAGIRENELLEEKLNILLSALNSICNDTCTDAATCASRWERLAIDALDEVKKLA